MMTLEILRKNIHLVEEKLGVLFSNRELLVLALTHRSFVNEYRGQVDQHNERLEFLGDSVLGLIVADLLYRRFPHHPEGQLSQLRSRLVDSSSCAKFLQKLNVREHILLGRGELLSSEGRAKSSILSDVFEAIMGAIYLDGGLAVARSFFIAHFEQDMEEAIESPNRNYKAELQDYSQRHFQKPPVYRVMHETGPDHAKRFSVVVLVADQEVGTGEGSSKKEAEQQAAFDALAHISKQPEESGF